MIHRDCPQVAAVLLDGVELDQNLPLACTCFYLAFFHRVKYLSGNFKRMVVLFPFGGAASLVFLCMACRSVLKSQGGD